MTTSESSPVFSQRLAAFLRFILRMVFVIIIAVGLGAAVYYGAAYGIPAIQRRYIQPVEDNALRLENLEYRYTQDLTLLESQIDSLSNRLTALEIQNDTLKVTLAEKETRLSAAEELQAAHAAALATLEPQVSALAGYQTDLESVQTTLDELASTINAQTQAIDALSENDQVRAELMSNMQGDLVQLQAMFFLTRGRMFLSQGNLGQAEANILAAHDLLIDQAADLPDFLQAVLTDIISYLEETLNMLPLSALNAADQLEGAWLLLIGEKPDEATSTPMPTNTGGITPTTTPSPTPTG